MSTKAKAVLTERDAEKIRRALPVTYNIVVGAEGLLSKKQISLLLGVSATTFYHLRLREGYPEPTTHFGKMPRWSVAAHNEWLAKRCAKDKED